MNISQVTKSFIQRNLATGDDFGGVKAGRDEAKRVDTELERIHTDAVDVRGSLDSLQEDSKLKPPTFANVSNKQVIIGAASAGAVVGGAIGGAVGIGTGLVTTVANGAVDGTRTAIRWGGYALGPSEDKNSQKAQSAEA